MPGRPATPRQKALRLNGTRRQLPRTIGTLLRGARAIFLGRLLRLRNPVDEKRCGKPGAQSQTNPCAALCIPPRKRSALLSAAFSNRALDFLIAHWIRDACPDIDARFPFYENLQTGVYAESSGTRSTKHATSGNGNVAHYRKRRMCHPVTLDTAGLWRHPRSRLLQLVA